MFLVRWCNFLIPLSFVLLQVVCGYQHTPIISSSCIDFNLLVHDPNQITNCALPVLFLKSPKHQSGSGIVKESVVYLCIPIITLHKWYCTTVAKTLFATFCTHITLAEVFVISVQKAP